MSKKEIYEKVSDMLYKLSSKDAECVIAKILEEYDYRMCANIVREESETCIMKSFLDYFDEGDDLSGFISLKDILRDYISILNTDRQNGFGDIELTEALRLETKDEKEENNHDNNLDWYIEDENIDLSKIIIGFKTK